MPEIAFQDYIRNNLPNALDLFNGENAFVGAATGSIIEFLGRCLSSKNGFPNNDRDFSAFVERYLSKTDQRYFEHWELIYEDLRHGSAHTTLTNGGVRLSNSPGDKKFHLTFFPEVDEEGEEIISFLIFTPQLLEDLKTSIIDFANDLENDMSLQESCRTTLRQIKKTGRRLIKKHYKP